MHNPVEPQLEYVFTIQAEIERPRSAGQSPTGERLHIPIIGGTVTGPKLQGRILPGGSDWPIIGSDGNSTIEAHYSIEADDGTLIYVVNKAKRVSAPEIISRLRNGEVIEPDQYYMRGAPVFDAPDGLHSWLRNRIFICSLAPVGKQIKIDVYVVG